MNTGIYESIHQIHNSLICIQVAYFMNLTQVKHILFGTYFMNLMQIRASFFGTMLKDQK